MATVVEVTLRVVGVDVATRAGAPPSGRAVRLRSAYRFSDDYPLATLAIDPDVLEQRWELTHPALVRDEEEMFW